MTGPVTECSDPVTVLQEQVRQLATCLIQCQRAYGELKDMAATALAEHAQLHAENDYLRARLTELAEELQQATSAEEILRRAAQSPPARPGRGLRLIHGSAAGVLGLMLAATAAAPASPGAVRAAYRPPSPPAAAPASRDLACEAIPAFTGHTAG